MLRIAARLAKPRNLLWIVLVSVFLWTLLGLLSSGKIDKDGEDIKIEGRPVANKVAPPSSQILPNYPVYDDVIVYNRVPKCASTSMRLVISQLASRNKFNLHVSKIYTQASLNISRQKALVRSVSSMPRPLIFVRHVYFLNFTRHGLPAPIYINMVREPLERMVSDYYYKRYHLKHMFPMSKETREMTFNECVEQNQTECVAGSPRGFHKVIPYFCGMDRICFKSSREALEMAKRNIEKYFTVVGVVEQVGEFLDVLEKLMPQYFKGSSVVYKLGGEKFKQMAKTRKKDPLNSSTERIMKDKLQFDYELYQFVKQRFHEQHTSLFNTELQQLAAR